MNNTKKDEKCNDSEAGLCEVLSESMWSRYSQLNDNDLEQSSETKGSSSAVARLPSGTQSSTSNNETLAREEIMLQKMMHDDLVGSCGISAIGTSTFLNYWLLLR